MHLFSSDIEKIRGYGDKYLEDNYQKLQKKLLVLSLQIF